MIKAKKSLGQNFLRDESIIERIVATAGITKEDRVFEIGPGTGVLTQKLGKYAKQVVALELDHQLVERLTKHFETSEGVSILEGNILDVNLNEMLEHTGFETGQYKVVANLPYYITASIIRTLLSLERQPESLTLMVQKEVAERMTAAPGSMSLLSLMVQYYAEAKIAFSVPAEAFDPVPKVESAVIHLVPKRAYNPQNDRQLFRIARAGFAARRKTLSNNLTSSLHLEKKEVEAALERVGLRTDIRAQALSLENWEVLQRELSL